MREYPRYLPSWAFVLTTSLACSAHLPQGTRTRPNEQFEVDSDGIPESNQEEDHDGSVGTQRTDYWLFDGVKVYKPNAAGTGSSQAEDDKEPNSLSYKILSSVAAQYNITIDPQDQEFFVEMSIYINKLSMVPVGKTLLDSFKEKKYKINLKRSPPNTGNSTNHTDTLSSIQINTGPGGETYFRSDGCQNNDIDKKLCQRPAQAWMTERRKYGMYHELVHAYHAANKTRIPSAQRDQNNVKYEEWKTLGVGKYQDEPVTENKIRHAMGKEEKLYYMDNDTKGWQMALPPPPPPSPSPRPPTI